MPQLCCAQTYSYFPVETDHPPPPNTGGAERWGRTRLRFQSTFYPTLLLARPDTMTLICLFLSAGYCDEEFQMSSAIIHLEWHYCQPFFAFRRGYMGYLLARKQEPAGPFGVVGLGRVCGLPCGDRGAHEVRLTAARDHARAFERAVSGTERLHFIPV